MRYVAAMLTVVTCAALLPACANADVYGPISLVSAAVPPAVPVEHAEQADYAHDPAISGDGRYVAFDGSFGGVTGVWRRDLETGAIEPVAVGPAGTSKGEGYLPSISEEGRYISFTTTARLTAADTNEGPDVYVRDMDVGESEPGAYTLASAVNGDEEGLTYTTTTPTRYGSIAAGRTALSANGRKVAFVTTAVSNLDGPETPAMQVAVRNLETKQTQLVSVTYDPATGASTGEPVPTNAEGAAAVYTGTNEATTFPAFPTLKSLAVGASISADGSTVAWLGEELERQAPTLAHEPHLTPKYSEPLWRRIDEGPQTPTRRVTGGGDPLSPACIASGETAPAEPTLSDPCQGPFDTEGSNSQVGTWTLGNEQDYLPRLSANGLTVAFLSNARYIAGGEEFGSALEFSNDLYVANMQPSLTRVQALTRLTEIAGGSSAEPARSAPIADYAISPSGTQVAFMTVRTQFPLGSPAFVSAPATEAGMDELFDVDLSNQTLTRVTHGYGGGPSEQPHIEQTGGLDPYNTAEGAFSPSFSADGNSLAFASTASNLVYDDGNTPPAVTQGQKGLRDGSDVFVVHRETFTNVAPTQYVSSPPPNPTVQPRWLLDVGARSLANGSVVVYVTTPAAGRLSISAKGSVRVGSSHAARRAHASGGRTRKSPTVRPKSPTVRPRVVAATGASAHASDGEALAATLTLTSRYRALANSHGGLSATVSIVFTAPGEPVLRATIPVTFLQTARLAKRHASRASAKR